MKKRNFRHVTQIGVKLLFSIMALLLVLTGCNTPTPNPPEDPTTPPPPQETEQPTELPTEQPTEESTTTSEVVERDIVSELGRIPAEEVSDVKHAWIDHYELREESYSSISIWLIGAFDDVYVMFVDGEAYFWTLPVLKKETVGEYRFSYKNSHPIEVYYNGQFYTLKEAYNNQWLTDENIYDVYIRYKEYYEK